MLKPATRRRAFTLIELLVVISIIALLVSILLPALGSARKTAVQLQCLSQIRSAGQAVHMYQTDNGQYYPFGWNTQSSDGGWQCYNDTLNTYLGMDDDFFTTLRSAVYHCPEIFPEATADAWGDPTYGYWAMYGHNPNIMPYGDTTNPLAQWNVAAYSRNPGEEVFIKEADLDGAPSEVVFMTEMYRQVSWRPTLDAYTLYTETTAIIQPHFTRELLEFRLSSPYAGDMVAGGGKGSIVYQDGHADSRLATDWDNSSFGLDSWHLSN